MLVGSDPQREFLRRRPGEIFGIRTDIATAEDVILPKLRWDAMLGGSQQQRRNGRNILRTSLENLNLDDLKSHVGQNRATLDLILASLDQTNG